MAAIISANGSRRNIQPANGTNFTLGELQTIVGGYIKLNGNMTMVVNEEGACSPSTLKRAEYSVPIIRRRKTSSSGTYM